MTHSQRNVGEDLKQGESHERLLLSPAAAIDSWLRRSWPPPDLPPAALSREGTTDSAESDAAMLELE